MSRLYEVAQQIDRFIHDRELPLFVTKGKISIQSGFPLGMIARDTPDDPDKLTKLLAAARTVLGDGFEA